jgi:TPR repeat protein
MGGDRSNCRTKWATATGMAAGAVLCLAALLGPAAKADFTDGITASTRISMEAAIRLWRKSAWQDDDFLSETRLGDVYGDERGDNKFYDPVESYVWYYIATASERIDEHIGDWYARRVIANDYHRALSQQQKLMVLMTAEQREDARKRIIYILSCRGADGFIRLGQLHSTMFQNDSEDPRWHNGGPPLADPGDAPVESPSTYGALTDDWHWEHEFRERARHEFEGGDALAARQMLGIPAMTVITPNDGEALMYFHIADNMGHPLAREYLRGLDRAVRNARWLGPRISLEAAERARYWFPPFEYYPPGDTASGVPHTDECVQNLDRQRALLVAERAIPPHDVQQALWFLGWSTQPFARFAALTGPAEFKAVARFQATLGEEPDGRLTPLETVRLIQTAAMRGDAASQNTLGVMYARGVGLPVNYVRAEYWFKKAGDQRFAAALYHLGVLYKVGPDGIHQDLSKANDYFTASALAGFKPTMNQLAELLSKADAGPHREGHQ